MATNFLEHNAEAWWRQVRPVCPPGTQLLTWTEFCSLLLGAFFPESVRQRLEEDLRNLQQGGHSVLEYIVDFNRLLNSVPHAARDEAHRVFELVSRASFDREFLRRVFFAFWPPTGFLDAVSYFSSPTLRASMLLRHRSFP